jgi:alpha-glucosidase
LLTRWTQVGAFTPYFRNHSVLESIRQEPWSFGEKYEKIIKRYIELRYQWLPQLYKLFAESNTTGAPIMRPMFYEFPWDETTYEISGQFMIGDNVIIAPILEPGKTHRAAYLPEGRWVNYWTEEEYNGGQYYLINAELDILPIFLKKGSMVIHGEKKSSTEVKDEKLILHYYYEPNSENSYTLYDDDGKTFSYLSGTYFKQFFLVKTTNDQIEIQTMLEGKYQPDWRKIKLVIHGLHDNIDLYVNGRKESLVQRENMFLAYI